MVVKGFRLLHLPHIGDSNYPQAWAGLVLVFVYYSVTTILFRMRLRRRAAVVVYDPPKGISPAVASFLFENGQPERAFSVALISLAGKGVLKIDQKNGQFLLSRLKDNLGSLPREESAILPELFMTTSLDSCAFDLRDSSRLTSAFRTFEKEIETVAIPGLISPHTDVWIAGAIATAALVIREVILSPIFQRNVSLLSLVYPVLIMILGGYCILAAVRIWPATQRKLASLLPGVNRPRRPLNYNDMIPFALTMSGSLGFAFLATMTSIDFSLLIIASISLVTIFRHLLEAPTRTGRAALTGLNGFREFLSRADADRLNKENQPGISPEILEGFSAYAVALRVEKSWGEEFTFELLELLQLDRASIGVPPTKVRTPRAWEPPDEDPGPLSYPPRPLKQRRP
jgi:hypothetical protein